MFYNHFLVGLLLRHVVELKTRLFIQRNVLVAGDLRGLLIAIFCSALSLRGTTGSPGWATCGGTDSCMLLSTLKKPANLLIRHDGQFYLSLLFQVGELRLQSKGVLIVLQTSEQKRYSNY